MSLMLRRLTTRAALASTLVLAGLCSTGIVGAQGPPADVFKVEHFANIRLPGVDADATVRITNPGSTGLRAWGTHVEVPGPGIAFVTETPFQDAVLSAAELLVLSDKCGDIFENGSGHGVCACGESVDDLEPTTAAPALCALIYVFSADQQMAECCGCPITANGLRTLSVTNDLTDNPLTGVEPTTGVIKVLSSSGSAAGAFPCDPSAPRLPPGPTTTTTSTTSTTTPTFTSTTTVSSSTSTTAPAGHVASACEGQDGLARVDCELRALTNAPLCDSISPRLQRLVIGKMNALRHRLTRGQKRGGTALGNALARMDAVLSTVEQKLGRAAKRRRITAGCQVGLARQISSLRGDMAALRQ